MTGAAAGRETLALYAGASPAARAHVRVRWHSCPFPAIAAEVPRSGRILEVGCGHGLLAAFLALESHARMVRGIDVAPDKVREARTAAEPARRLGADLDFACVQPGELPPGPWDAIVIVDVMYLLEESAQRSLLACCADLLAPGGVLAVKEMSIRPRWKFWWNAVQETLAVRLFRITWGGSFTFLPPATLERTMRELGLQTLSRRLDRGRPYPHHLLVGQRLREDAG
jgi:2-polyprenyl-3-methyl-5-hydroxy-6-metoxy-1,4-benzoquinol methylase